MDDSGNIKLFDSEKDAIDAGYKTLLTKEENNKLCNLPEQDRHAWLAWYRHEETIPKMDTISKLKYRNGFIAGFKANTLKTD